MEDMLSTSKFEEEQNKDLKDRDPKYKYCFEVITPSRGFLFCAETESEMQDWIRTFNAVCTYTYTRELILGEHLIS